MFLYLKLILLFGILLALIPLNDEGIWFVHFPAIPPLSPPLSHVFKAFLMQ